MSARENTSTTTTVRNSSARNRSDTSDDRRVATIMEGVKARLAGNRYDKWFSHAAFTIDAHVLRIATPSPYVRNWIESHYSQTLRDAAINVLGDDAQVAVVVVEDSDCSADGPGESCDANQSTRNGAASNGNGRSNGAHHGARADAPGKAPSASRRTTNGRSASTARWPRKGAADNRRNGLTRRLDDFIVGRSNELAAAGAARLADPDEDDTMSPLFLYSSCGLGKTHLLQGICRRYIECTGRPHRVRYMTGEQFTNEYIASVKAGDVDAFRERMRKLELLVIDDVRFLANKMRTQSELLYTLDELDMKGARVALSSDVHPRQVRGLRQPLVSRFLSGMVVQIDRPDRETRLKLARTLSARRGLKLNDAAVDAVAGQCLASVREMEGALTNVKALCDLTETTGEIGMVVVKQVFEEDAWQPNNPVRIATVIDVVCDELGVSRAELIGSRRNRQVVTARGLVAFLGRELTSHSYPEIAQEMGRKYHSTVHTAAQRLQRQLREDETVQLGRGEPPMRVQELVDQIRHSIMRGGCTRQFRASAAGRRR